MDTEQLLDLFSVNGEKKKEKPSAQQSNATGKTSLKTMIENLGEYNLQLHWLAEVKNSMRHFGIDDCQFNNLALCLCW